MLDRLLAASLLSARAAATTLALLLAATASPSRAEQLVIRLADPEFVITVPGVPQIPLGRHPSAAQVPAARLFGASTNGVTVAAFVSKAPDITAQQCASWLLGHTISKYLLPLDQVQTFPAGARAWVLLYSYMQAGVEQLRGHVFSGNDKGECLEVHIYRMGATEQERKDWFAGFRNATVTGR